MDELIESIYQAACAPELWPQVLSQLLRSIDAAVATILHRDKNSSEGPVVDITFGGTPAQMESYSSYFRKVDFRFREVQKLPPGGVLIDDHNFDFESFTRTEIYQDFWKPARIGKGLAGVLFKDVNNTSILSVRRPAGSRPFAGTEIRKFRQVLPHIRRSLHFQGHLLRANVRAEALAIALDQFPVAVFLLDRHCAVLDRNRAARELLSDVHTPIQIGKNSLSAIRPADDRELREAVRVAASSLHNLEALPRFLRLPCGTV